MSKVDALWKRMECLGERRAVAVGLVNRFRTHNTPLLIRAAKLADRIISEDAATWRPAIAELINEEPAATENSDGSEVSFARGMLDETT